MFTGLGASLNHFASKQRIGLGEQAANTAAVQVSLDQLRGQRGIVGELRSVCPHREQLINAINTQPRALHLKHHVD